MLKVEAVQKLSLLCNPHFLIRQIDAVEFFFLSLCTTHTSPA